MINWIKNFSNIPIETIFAFDECQFEYFDKSILKDKWAILFKAKPYIPHIIKIRAPKVSEWVDEILLLSESAKFISQKELRDVEIELMDKVLHDFITYVYTPNIYDTQPFNNWDEKELLAITDFENKRVIDVGSGTGKQAFIVSPLAKAVYCVEPVIRLRQYINAKAKNEKITNVYTLDGFIDAIPFENEFADVVMAGHVFGDNPKAELKEMFRVLKTGGILILIPGNVDEGNESHKFLMDKGFEFAKFYEPEDGYKRKYWLTKK